MGPTDFENYEWGVEFKVKIDHLMPPETASENVSRQQLQTHINTRAYNWINKKENLHTLLNLIFPERNGLKG